MKVTQNLANCTHEGWSLQVYTRDRRLLCMLEASHIWVFMGGIFAGLLLTLIGMQIRHAQASVSEPVRAETVAPPVEPGPKTYSYEGAEPFSPIFGID